MRLTIYLILNSYFNKDILKIYFNQAYLNVYNRFLMNYLMKNENTLFKCKKT